MQQLPPTNQTNDGVTKWMVILAWIAGLGLITFVFAELLEQQFNPNQSPDSYRQAGSIEVRLVQNRAGHYVASGSINQHPVVFLVDTGATDVSIPAHLADKLGLLAGRRAYAQTANGVVPIAETRINEIAIGDIKLFDVEANLNPSMQGNEILLGMSFLRQIEFTQKGNELILRTL
ncbi:retropepsin-like aspartic protease family protein [Alteromonas facilis]|uniref:retropepsin-like aspartic protease family protein n=1 Tax=Alteromonas facilis TaxID=2048004 RepID=UPI001F0BAA5D|nr:TIGR02281 family clan AA aspartic protease [Alteromonas facilis]